MRIRHFASSDGQSGSLRKVPAPEHQPLRLVVQYIREGSSRRYSYRLIGYSDRHTLSAGELPLTRRAVKCAEDRTAGA